MRRRILMVLLAAGTFAGFGSAACHAIARHHAGSDGWGCHKQQAAP